MSRFRCTIGTNHTIRINSYIKIEVRIANEIKRINQTGLVRYGNCVLIWKRNRSLGAFQDN